ncbi:unnamed protein product [Rotaria sp. Silwood2]|nr:unnamed protein product [Rotaria sp. Silwood2]
MDNELNRYYIKIRTILGIDPKTIHEELVTVLGPNAPSYTTVTRWAKRFREGREEVNDDPRFGRPISELTDENIELLSSEEQNRQDKPPSLLEVEEAIRRMKSGKAPGMDGVSTDVIKAGGYALSIRFHTLFVEIWEEKETIDDWSTAIIISPIQGKR